jgi:aminoglycoside phosphotransferase (APT) family kinase protein
MEAPKETVEVNPHLKDVEDICLKEFGSSPKSIERMKVGSANEVYAVEIKGENYIIRLNEKSEPLQGSDKYIPLFKSLGIKVPDIVGESYSKDIGSHNYQIQTRLEGTDIGKVIAQLTEDQLKGIAHEIASIAKKLLPLPTNGKFGYADITESKLKDSWNEAIADMLNTIKDRTSKTGVVDQKYITAFERAVEKYADYLSKVPSQFYFDDMSSKNVIINNGVFNGIVDLDGVAYGDYLEGIGRIKASWYGTEYGNTYTNAVTESLDLDEKQKEIVTLYALLNRIHWLAETGIQFNQNTSTKVDPAQVAEGEAAIEGLMRELEI